MNIFSNPYKSTETWSAQGAIVQWGTGGKATTQFPLMMVGVEMTYARKIQQIFPINSAVSGDMTKINVSGAPVGTLQVSSIYGPFTTGLASFIEAVSKGCKGPDEQVTLKISPFGKSECKSATGAGTGSFQDMDFILEGLDMEQVALRIQGSEATVVNVPTVFSFTNLQWLGSVGGPDAAINTNLPNPFSNIA